MSVYAAMGAGRSGNPGGGPLAIVAIATLASLVPAYRAARIDTVKALRAE